MLDKIIRSIPVLCYHDMGTPGGHDLETFKKHLATIKELGFQTITATYLYAILTGQKKLDGKYIVLTFDDCHISNWVHTIPLLAKENMRGVFFAVTDFIAEGPARDPNKITKLDKLSDSFRKALRDKDYSQFMNLGELKSAIQDFGMEIYAHSARHQGCFKNTKQVSTISQGGHWSIYGIYKEPRPEYPVFEIGSAYVYNGYWPVEDVQGSTFKVQCPTDGHFNLYQKGEIFKAGGIHFRPRSDEERYKFCLSDFKRSYETIREINKSNLQLFCWPWGHYDKLSLTALKETGFAGAFSLERYYNGPGTDPFRIHRIGIGRKKDHKWLKTRLYMHANALGSRIFFKFFRKKGSK